MIASQLIWLTAFSLSGNQEEPEDWDRFKARLGVELDRLAEGNCDGDLGKAVSELLAWVKGTYGGDDVHHTIRQRVEGIEALQRNSFNCIDCGAVGRSCVGRPDKDSINFKESNDPNRLPAGACLGFLRWLTIASLRCAMDLYERLGVPDLTPLPDEIVLKVCSGDIDATVPVNGEIERKGKSCELRVIWPEATPDTDIRENVREGIRMIAWLLFHEVFVHVFQARARPDCVTTLRIPPDCGFTEGAVDSVAVELLGPHLLRSDIYPAEIGLLRDVFDDGAARYSRERRERTAGHRRTMPSQAERHRIARHEGWKSIWQPLSDMESRYPRTPRLWAAEIVMRLNLELDRRERADILHFMKNIPVLEGNGPRLEMFKAFNRYHQRECDRTALLGTLECLSGHTNPSFE